VHGQWQGRVVKARHGIRSTAEASIRNVARSAGYEVVAIHTFLPDDTIFVLRVLPNHE